MYFVAVMLFTHQVFHLECLLLLFQIKSQPADVYKSIVYKRAFKVVFKSSKNEKITMPHEFIFVFYLVFHWGNIVGKVLPKPGEFEKPLRPLFIS